MARSADRHPCNNENLALLSAALAKSTVSLPDDRLGFTSLPLELVIAIINTVTDQRDLTNLMTTCERFSEPAEKRLWRVSNTKGYRKLLGMELVKQRRFANCVRHQSIIFEEHGVQPAKLGIQLPRLQELSISHNSLSTAATALDISSLTTACLTRLTISNGTIYNLLPALVLIKKLQYLKIGYEVHVQDSDAEDFLRVFEFTSPIKTLCAGPVSSDELFVKMASHETIADFTASIHLGLDTIVQALEVPSPFSNLQRLRIATQASAAKLLLPKMVQLKILELKVTQDLSPGETYTSAAMDVFCAIGCLRELQELILMVIGFDIQAEVGMFCPLRDLVNLRKLNVIHDIEENSNIRDMQEFLPLSPFCALTEVHLDLRQQQVPRPWIEKLARDYPTIKTLSLGTFVKLNELSAHFPALEDLSFVSPAVRCKKENM